MNYIIKYIIVINYIPYLVKHGRDYYTWEIILVLNIKIDEINLQKH